MCFKVDTGKLNDALRTLRRLAPSTPFGTPAATGVKLRCEGNQLALAATDLDTYAETSLEVQGRADGEVLVPARMFGELVAAAPNEDLLSFDADGVEATIEAGAFRANVRLLPVDEFPMRPNVDAATEYAIDGDALARAVSFVAPAVSKDEALPALASIRFEVQEGTATVVATDRNRMAWVDVDADGDGEAEAMVPPRAATELARMAGESGDDVVLGFTNNHASILVGDVWAASRLIEGVFPGWRSVVPSDDDLPRRLEVDAAALTAAIRRAEIVAPPGKAPYVTLKATPGVLTVEAGAPDVGRYVEELAANVDDEFLFRVQPRYLLDGLALAPEGSAHIRFHDDTERHPAMIEADDTTARYLVMPVLPPRLSKAA